MNLKFKILCGFMVLSLIWACQSDKPATDSSTSSQVNQSSTNANNQTANTNTSQVVSNPSDNVGSPVIKNSNNQSTSGNQNIQSSNTNQGSTAPMDADLKRDLQAKLDQIARLEGEGKIPKSELDKKRKAIEEQLSSKVIPVKEVDPDALPSACSLVTDDFLAGVLNVDVRAIQLKDGSQRGQNSSRACFFKWDHDGNPNAGVLVQVQKNPLPGEIEQWAPYYIQAKLHQGDQDPQSGQAFKYKAFDLGVAGAYSYEMHRYMWRTGEDRVFMVAFNLNGSEKNELQWARTIGAEVMKNYNRTRQN